MENFNIKKTEVLEEEEILSPEQEAEISKQISETLEKINKISQVTPEEVEQMEPEKRKKFISTAKIIFGLVAVAGIAITIPNVGALDNLESVGFSTPESIQAGVGAIMTAMGSISFGIRHIYEKWKKENQ